jgi:hypothetical protein
MKKIIVLLFAIVLTTSSSRAATPGDMSARVIFPGTGVGIVPPPGTRTGPSGTYLIDETGETIIFFGMSDTKFNVENDPTWRGLYRRNPEHIVTPALTGNLYRRTRAEDGGAWDGWFFAVPRGEKVLTVMVSYTGHSNDIFNGLRKHLLTISWNDSGIDPELALGVKLSTSALRLVKGTFGAIAYNESGEAGGAGPNLLLQPLPVPPQKAELIFPAGCEKVLGAAFGGKPFEGPNMLEQRGTRLCEAWSKVAEHEMRYVALIRLPSGALINAMGTATSNRFQATLPVFRSAINSLRPHPARVKYENK